ncbi:MAG: hypothetical protein M3437_10795 [Chloroflexota bacterium]|nr:hypothetical protein [Chloroflexota bacterium]MDQ5867440.1 hypothetical protein [Chloroflexota bacterium]
MEQDYTAKVWQQGDWFVAQCLEVDIARKGETEEDALANLKEALELRFEPQSATSVTDLKGSAGSLDQPKSWEEIIQIAREDHFEEGTSRRS